MHLCACVREEGEKNKEEKNQIESCPKAEGHKVEEGERRRTRRPDPSKEDPLTARSKWDRLENMAPVFVGLIIVFLPAHPPSSLCLGVGEARSAARAFCCPRSRLIKQRIFFSNVGLCSGDPW
jgi:hypothetical protein